MNFSKDEYKRKLGTLPRELVMLLAVRIGWRILLFTSESILKYNNKDYLIAVLNAYLIASLNDDELGIKPYEKAANLACAWTGKMIYDRDAPKGNSGAYIATVYGPASIATSLIKMVNSKGDSYIDNATNVAYTAFATASNSLIANAYANNTTIRSSDADRISREQIYPDLEKALTGSLSINTPLFDSKKGVCEENLFAVIKSIDVGFRFYLPFIKRRLNGLELTAHDVKLKRALLAVSKEKHDQGPSTVFQFIQDYYYDRLTEKVNISRVIFIGPGGVGKTSLIKALNGQKVVEGEEKPTPGISTSNWKWGDDCNIDISFWDFAGQVTTHAMHKFFLRERCLYVLLLTTRDDQAMENQAEYWLEHVRLYGNNSPVIVVANKIDGDSEIVNFNEKDLLIKYPSIISFKKIAAAKAKDDTEICGTTYRNLFDEFKNNLVDSIKQVAEQYKNELTENENKVKEDLFNQDVTDFIDNQLFDEICGDNNITGKQIGILKEFFNKLGIIVHFPDLNDDALLNPKWLSYGVYEVLRQAEKARRKGWISKNEIREHLKKGVKLDDGTSLRYTVEKINTLIIECIVKFKLGYSICREGVDYLVMPSVLDKNQPEHNFIKGNNFIHFVFDFEVLLPPYMLHAFVSKSSSEIPNDLVWQTGVFLEDDSKLVKVLVENFAARKIDIYVCIEKDSDRKRATLYLHKLLDRFREIINGEKGSEQPVYSECVEIPKEYYAPGPNYVNGGSRIIPYEVLIGGYQDGEETGRTEYGKFDIKKFFGDCPMKKEIEKNHYENCTINNVTGDQFNSGKDQNIVCGDQIKAEGNVTKSKNDVIEQLKPLLVEFVELGSVSKEIRKEIKDVKNLLEELSEYPEDVECEDVDAVVEKFNTSGFLNNMVDVSTISANIMTVGEKIAPLLILLKGYMGT